MSSEIKLDPDRDHGDQLREIFAHVGEEFAHLVHWRPRPDTPHGGVVVVDDEDVPNLAAPVGTNFASTAHEQPAGEVAGNQPLPAGDNPEGDDEDDTPPPPPTSGVDDEPPAAPDAPEAPVAPAEPVATAVPASSGPRGGNRGRRATAVIPSADPTRPAAPQNQEPKA